MAKTYREWELGQRRLFPPSVQELVPEGHLAHFVRDSLREQLDPGATLATYQKEREYSPCQPTRMTALLLYAYAQGVYSSRMIPRSCEEHVDFMPVTETQKPDFRTVSNFRKRHLKALSGLFDQMLKLCQKAGMVKLGHVALDGTKFKANASKRKAMSYGRMDAAERALRQEVGAWMQRADEQGRDEDRRFGREKRCDELPDWVKNKQERIKRIQAAKQALEADAKTAASGASDDDEHEPDAKKQRNFTDPVSQIMKTRDGFKQAYNAQAAVDAGSQMIVAATLTNTQNDGLQLLEILHQIRAHAGRRAREVSADSSYCSVESLRALAQCKIDGCVATGRQKHVKAANDERSLTTWIRKMAAKLKRGGWRSRYRMRKVTVEPVFGQIKEARGFRRFLLRGLAQVSGEWHLICAVHNLRKLAVVRS